MKPLGIDLFAGLGGFTEGLMAAGYDVVGFDIQRHFVPVEQFVRPSGDGWETASMKPKYYPGRLVLQDVMTIHGSQFRDAAVIVASPPCQKYSWLAMPWSRSEDPENSKAAKALRKLWETEGPDNRLFDACFRIQREACEAAGRYIPLIVENVRGAQPWVGRAKANYGSFYLWGDVAQIGDWIHVGPDIGRFGAGLKVPGRAGKNAGGSWFNVAHNTESGHGRNPVNGLTPVARDEVGRKVPGFPFDGSGRSFQTASVEGMKANPDGTNHPQGSWFRIADSSQGDRGTKTPGRSLSKDAANKFGPHNMGSAEKIAAELGTKIGGDWFRDPACHSAHGSKSNARKQASALIAKIPFLLSEYVARACKPKG